MSNNIRDSKYLVLFFLFLTISILFCPWYNDFENRFILFIRLWRYELKFRTWENWAVVTAAIWWERGRNARYYCLPKRHRPLWLNTYAFFHPFIQHLLCARLWLHSGDTVCVLTDTCRMQTHVKILSQKRAHMLGRGGDRRGTQKAFPKSHNPKIQG